MRAAWARVAPGCCGVGLGALLLAAACLVALLLVALFPATDLPPSETYLFYAYCVLVIRAWTYEYAQGRMSIHVYCVLVVRAWTYEYGLNQMMSGGFSLGIAHRFCPLGGSQSLLCISNGV